MLLNNRARASAQGGRYVNALQASSYNGCGDIVTLLQEHSASRASN